MADKVVVISQQALKPIKLIKWKVNEGNSVSIGCVVLLYEVDGDDKHVVCKLKSTQAGAVHKLLVQEGDVVKPGVNLLELQACLHPTVMRDMCAECGADLRKDDIATSASVPMVHSVPELKVSVEQAQKIGKADVDRLLKDRKLVLLVDLDQTLIHTTNDNIPANIKDVYHFQLYGAHSPWYHTRLRPGTHQFLKNIFPYFELHICTFGARNYAHMIAMFLDQDGQLFSHRILSRDECFNPTSKTANLKALFPCGDDLVCIIDDREDVWSFAANLIHVKPYHFFQHTGDINAPPGLDKHESDDKEGIDLTKVNSDNQKKIKINGSIEMKHEKENNDAIISPENEDSSFDKNVDTEFAKNQDYIQDKICKDDLTISNKQNENCLDLQSRIVPNSKNTKADVNDCVDQDELGISTENKVNLGQNDKDIKMENQNKENEKVDVNQSNFKQYSKDTKTENKIKENNDVEVNEINLNQNDKDIKTENPRENQYRENKELEVIDSNFMLNDGLKVDNQNKENKDIELNGSNLKEKDVKTDDQNKDEVNELNLKQADKDITNNQNVESKSEVNESNLEQSNKCFKTDQQNENDKKNELNEANLEETDKGINIENKENEENIDDEIKKTTQNNFKQYNAVPENDSKEEELIEIEDPDDYLLYLEHILLDIHKTFYDRYDKMESGKVPDLKKVIPEVRRNVLNATKLVFSGLVPTHIKLEQSKAYQVAKSLGATVTQDLEGGTTHLVAVRPGTAKVNAGRRKKNLKIVTPDWLWACAERWEHVDERLYPLNNKGSKNRHPPPHCSSPEHNTNFEAIPETPTRKRTPSGRFMDTINPLMSFSSADIADMDREVEDIFNESESDGESSKKAEKDLDDVFIQDFKKSKETDDSSSSSDESLTGEHPHGWRPTKLINKRRRSRDEDGEDESTVDEFPSTKFRRGEQLSSDLDIGQDSNSDGSVSAPDEIDDGDWNMMGAALEREFLSNN